MQAPEIENFTENHPHQLSGEARWRTLRTMFDLFVRPEMMRRQLPPETSLNAFQIAWLGRSCEPEIRLDREVRAVAVMTAPRDRDYAVGGTFAPGPETKVEAIGLPPQDEGRYAHFTAVRVGRKWLCTFDFRRQLPAARAHAQGAREFLEVAEHCLASGLGRAFVDNAHSCAELLVKVDLLLMSSIDEGPVQHRDVKAAAAKVLHLEDQRSLLTKLAKLRLSARYFVDTFDAPGAELEGILNLLRTFVGIAKQRCANLSPFRVGPPSLAGARFPIRQSALKVRE